ncbi:MAG: hypothetical protein IPL86_15040 [Flavobacteriales bacterium]|nr:hypothetical protein [Flavobacteriales bacterium]
MDLDYLGRFRHHGMRSINLKRADGGSRKYILKTRGYFDTERSHAYKK